MSRKPRDERDLLNLPKLPEQPHVEERETLRAENSSQALEGIGRRFEGLDGKKYLGSYAVHVFEVKNQLKHEHVWLIQSTDLTKLSEQTLILTIRELGRALMKRFGAKPPASTLDKFTHESERSV